MTGCHLSSQLSSNLYNLCSLILQLLLQLQAQS